jgi:hypothetical protein
MDVPYESLEHAVDLPRAGVYARRIARFEREFARWMATDDGRYAAWRARRTLARDGVGRDDGAARRGQGS